ADGIFYESVIGIAEDPGADIAAIDRKKSQHLYQRALQAVQSHIRGVTVAARDRFQQARQAVDVARHVFAHNQALFFEGELVTRALLAGEAAVDLREFLSVRARAEYAANIVEKLVAGGALDGPGRQLFIEGENFFHDDIDVGQLTAQTVQVGGRVVEAVDVIYSQAGEQPFARKLQNQSMGLR